MSAAQGKPMELSKQSLTPAENELVEKLAKTLHRFLCAARNIEWEAGDTCDDCKDDIQKVWLPIIRNYVRQQSAPDATERMKCGHLRAESVSDMTQNERAFRGDGVEETYTHCAGCERETTLLELAIEMGGEWMQERNEVPYYIRVPRPTPDDMRKRYEERRNAK